MIYYQMNKNEKGDILLCEPGWDSLFSKKTETVFSQCNGYLGVRASYEWRRLEESRGTFLGGLYHQAGPDEVTELINCPDVTEFKLKVDGREFYPDRLPVISYDRHLNVRTGQLGTDITYDLGEMGLLRIETERFVSRHEKALLCHQVKLTLQQSKTISLQTGINGQITNSGVSHFSKTQALVFDQEVMYSEFTTDDGQKLKISSVCLVDGGLPENRSFVLERRSIYETAEGSVAGNQTLTIEKYTVFDSGDSAGEDGVRKVRQAAEEGYETLAEKNRQAMEKFWHYATIEIDGATPEEEGAIAFAQYHLFGMVPGDTSRFSVAAKGLTGEGYKGHVFWDTEMFVMPFFTSLFPETAKNLLKYRYDRLDGARKKAAKWGYLGALYPWESAATGDEETPPYAALNIHTGKAARVWSGVKEHHVTADIAFAVRQYFRITGDLDFMKHLGNEMILETACFWFSRAEYKKDQNRYEILDVIGPDEYTEHIDNNAYTNYLAYENVSMALDILRQNHSQLTERYLEEGWEEKWDDFLKKLYLPAANGSGLIPQDDTFLTKKELPNIETYRKSKIKQEILRDFSRDQVVDMQVLKQADLVMLLNLMPERFTQEEIKGNVRYYEARSVHDSSLSYCAHASACARIGDTDLAYTFFKKALEVDLDTNETDSRDGIHAASLGGILNCLLDGFAGISFTEQGITVTPHLPETWRGIRLFRKYRGEFYKIRITGDEVFIEKEEQI